MSDDTQKDELQDDAKKVLPLYIAVDHSWSMSENGKMAAANELIPAIMDACIEHPLADEKARFSIVGFNDKTQVVAPLSRGTNLPQHQFTAANGTSFTNLFWALQDQIETDYQQLKADGFKVYRPTVFLLTDGEPMCDKSERDAAFAALTDKAFLRNPNISVFGVGPDVTEETAKSFTAGRGIAILTKNGVPAGMALTEFIAVLVMSIVNSTGKLVDSSEDGDDGFEWDMDALTDDFVVGLES